MPPERDVLSDRETLVHRIACELDMPSLYMGGPSLSSKRKAERIMDLLPEIDRLRERVAELEAELEAGDADA